MREHEPVAAVVGCGTVRVGRIDGLSESRLYTAPHEPVALGHVDEGEGRELGGDSTEARRLRASNWEQSRWSQRSVGTGCERCCGCQENCRRG